MNLKTVRSYPSFLNRSLRTFESPAYRKKPILRNRFHVPNGGPGRNRTNDTRIFSPLLYRLSYGTIWLRGKDLNQRPPGYEPDELPGCSTPRCLMSYSFFVEDLNGGGTGIRTQAPVSRPTGFQDRTLQPLGYSSNFVMKLVDPVGLEPTTHRL